MWCFIINIGNTTFFNSTFITKREKERKKEKVDTRQKSWTTNKRYLKVNKNTTGK